MSRNKCFFRVRISHVLRFISNCVPFTESPPYIHITWSLLLSRFHGNWNVLTNFSKPLPSVTFHEDPFVGSRVTCTCGQTDEQIDSYDGANRIIF
jgi:hypothetical protein